MVATASFTPQQAINSARLRHPSLTTLVLDDITLINDLNRILNDLVVDIVSVNDAVLATRCAPIAAVGADGSVIDLAPVEGEIFRLIDLECLKSAVTRQVVLRDLRQRYTLKSEFADDPRPCGCLWFDSVTNNRWQILEIGGWTGVTTITPWAVIKPAEITQATLANQLVLPFAFFLPLVERIAILLAQRTNLDDAWQVRQAGVAGAALKHAMARFTNQAGEAQLAPPPDATAARRPL